MKMAGKLAGGLKEMGAGGESHTTKVNSSKSILSYQNGSGFVGRECRPGAAVQPSPPDKALEETTSSSSSFSSSLSSSSSPSSDGLSCPQKHMSAECLHLLRKKLISELSIRVFRTDLEARGIDMEPVHVSKERLSVIQKLLLQIRQLSDAEKLVLYLKLSNSLESSTDPLGQPLNPLGNRQEIQQTIVWIKTHLEEDREISIPKQDVYEQYLKYCENVSMKPLSTADFGKVMKQVYPGVRPRRLGTRGNSRYCYSGMRNTSKLPVPSLPQLGGVQSTGSAATADGAANGGSTKCDYKTKKPEKPKRKWKTAIGRNCKQSGASHQTTEADSKVDSWKCLKRSKIEGSTLESANDKVPEGRGGDTTNLYNNVKTEDKSLDRDVSFEETYGNTLHSAYDFGSCLDRLNIKSVGLNGVDDKRGLMSEGVHRNGESEASHGSGLTNVKSPKVRARKAAAKFHRNMKKAYVPIQPKPATGTSTAKLKVHFDFELANGGHVKKNCGAPVCEESDSQEPEEEIVRYFQREKSEASAAMAAAALDSVNNSGIDQSSTEVAPDVKDGRSRSCVEYKESKPPETTKRFSLQRSQSSVELTGMKNQVSHLRLLLEYSSDGDGKKSTFSSSVFTSGAPTSKLTRPPIPHGNEYNNTFPRAESSLPQQPSSTCYKYSSFTPISPGPRTPTTPLTSAFVSPRNTPIHGAKTGNPFPCDSFVPPNTLEKKPTKQHSFNSSLVGSSPNTVTNRPRSNSSTNFYRAKTRSRVLACAAAPARQPPGVNNNSALIADPYHPTTEQSSVMSDSLSHEIRQFLENQSSAQFAGCRSQSVPLNRMMSEGTPGVPNQYVNPVSNEFGEFAVEKSLESFASSQAMGMNHMNGDVFQRQQAQVMGGIVQMEDQLYDSSFVAQSAAYNGGGGSFVNGVFTQKMDVNANALLSTTFPSEDGVKGYFPGAASKEEDTRQPPDDRLGDFKLFGISFYDDGGGGGGGGGGSVNGKDPVITSFKPVLNGEFASCPNSPTISASYFGAKSNDDNQLIEFLGLNG